MFIHLGTKKVILLWIHHSHVHFVSLWFESPPTHSNLESLKLPESREKLLIVPWIVGKIIIQKTFLSVLSSLKSKWFKSVPGVDGWKLSAGLFTRSTKTSQWMESRSHDVPLESPVLRGRPSVFMCAFWCRPPTGESCFPTFRVKHRTALKEQLRGGRAEQFHCTARLSECPGGDSASRLEERLVDPPIMSTSLSRPIRLDLIGTFQSFHSFL